MKLPRFKTPITARMIPHESDASAARFTASFGLSMLYLLTKADTSNETIATGPSARQLDVPKIAYTAAGKTLEYRPFIAGKLASFAYEIA